MTATRPIRMCLTVLAAAMLSAICPAVAHADTAAQFQRGQAFQKANWTNYLDEMPVLDADHPSRPLADVMSLTIIDGQLTVRTALPSTRAGAQVKVKLDSSPDWSVLSVLDGSADKTLVIPTNFALIQNQFAPDRTDTLQVEQSKAAALVIVHQIMTPGGRFFVQLQCQYASANQPGHCRLSVFDQATPNAAATPPLTWDSENFGAFERDHPIEAERYLRPIFHTLDQDAALAPDPMLAFQVFSSHWAADPAMTAKVNALVAELGAGNFHTRSRAEQDLTDMGEPAAIVLLHLDRSTLNPEQNARIDKILAPYSPLSAKQAAALGTQPVFLVDCLYSDDETIRKIAFAQLQSVTKLKLNFNPTAPAAQRTTDIPPLLKQLIDAKIIASKP